MSDFTPDLAPEEIAALRARHDLTFHELPAEVSPLEAERETNRLLRALGEADAEMSANLRVHNDEVARLKQWLDRVNGRLARTASWLSARIEYFAPFVPRFGKKSRDLPYGEIAWRTNPKRLVVTDPDAAVAWAKANGLPVATKETVAHADLARAWKERKIVPPGCTEEPEEEMFSAKPKGVG